MFIELIAGYKQKTPNATAILAPQKQPITYGRLFQHLVKTASSLQRLGITHTDRVALVMNNGPEMATAFLAIGSVAVCVPMNSHSSLSEFKTYLSAVRTKALVIADGLSTEATTVAMELGIEIITVKCEGNEAGIFDIINAPPECQKAVEYSKPEDVALILFTSGTTGKPKIVPLTHSNIYSCTRNIVSSLVLSSKDRCLNVMPLFHSGGLVMSMLSTLFAGGSIVCTNGFVASQFFRWLSELSPTWYSAVTAIHHAILQEWEHLGQPSIVHSLRFIRCGSAALPPHLAQKLESVLQIPIIEGYGSSEAVSQITVNPLPPGQRKLGSAGKSTGCKVEIMDEFGNLLPAGVSGEIVIQGDSVFLGYENDSAANLNSFCNGWFRTGDQGYIDGEGYLYINGRIKEIINCGGAKISPREVEEVLLLHPAVKEVVAFAIPHLSLGEVIAVAIVMKRDKIVSQEEIQRYASKHVVYYKVPHRVVFVDDIPKEATGKVNRIGMAEKLGASLNIVDDRIMKTSDCDELEHKMIDIWRKILKKSDIEIDKSFFNIGGDSLTATFLSVEIESVFGKYIPVSLIYENDTIEKLVLFLSYEEYVSPYLHLVPLQTAGKKPPLFTIDTIGGNIPYYRNLAVYLGRGQPVYALKLNEDYNESVPETIEQIASKYVREIFYVQPKGPYYLAGYSLGGTIAFEVAQQLYRTGQQVALLAMFDTRNHNIYPLNTLLNRTVFFMRRLRAVSTLNDKIGYISSMLFRKITKAIQVFRGLTREEKRWKRIVQYKDSCYVPLRYPGQLTLFRAIGDPILVKSMDAELGWNGLADGGIVVYETPGDHWSMVNDENIKTLAKKISLCMSQERTI
ncbi:non-ribosomal peptide synthetase [Anaerospora hongkongensis]|uniref:non-ribosomal peptide synthetase n=1 Tax=Anaerospora hongkongensis TaxID=244830 RepID=UPI00289B42E7|nr:non-ribosomal peptide synthetase [Anaerospora hongkongensis]